MKGPHPMVRVTKPLDTREPALRASPLDNGRERRDARAQRPPPRLAYNGP
jgi:hypothetical protein